MCLNIISLIHSVDHFENLIRHNLERLVSPQKALRSGWAGLEFLSRSPISHFILLFQVSKVNEVPINDIQTALKPLKKSETIEKNFTIIL